MFGRDGRFRTLLNRVFELVFWIAWWPFMILFED